MFQSTIAGTVWTWVWSQWDFLDKQDSAITCNSVAEFHYGHQSGVRNQWSWSQLDLIYTHYLLIIYSISHQFRFLIWALITAVIAVCSANWWFHCSLRLFMCGCQEAFCCFSYVSISKNSSPNHQKGIQKSSKSPKWDFELGSSFRGKSEDFLQKENKFFRDFWCPADWLLEPSQVARNHFQEVSAVLWHLYSGCRCCITSGASLSLTYCRAATISCPLFFSRAMLISAFLNSPLVSKSFLLCLLFLFRIQSKGKTKRF